MKVECGFEIEAEIINGHEKKKIIIKNDDYVPNICTNLLSVRQMTKDGKKVVFKNENCNIFDKEGELIVVATVHNGLYQGDCNALINQNKVFVAKNTIFLWHRRLGLICDKNLVNLVMELILSTKNKTDV